MKVAGFVGEGAEIGPPDEPGGWDVLRATGEGEGQQKDWQERLHVGQGTGTGWIRVKWWTWKPGSARTTP